MSLKQVMVYCMVLFAQLCQSARSQNDYIELSWVTTVLLADVLQMGATSDI